MKPFDLLTVLFATTFFFSSCGIVDSHDTDTTPQKSSSQLQVRFYNNSASEYSISSIELMDMGFAGTDTPTPSGVWNENVLPQGIIIDPGNFFDFTTVIPNSHYSVYRLTVLDSSDVPYQIPSTDSAGNTLLQGEITHWGGDTRTVSVTVVQSTVTTLPIIQGYSDFAGIDSVNNSFQ